MLSRQSLKVQSKRLFEDVKPGKAGGKQLAYQRCHEPCFHSYLPYLCLIEIPQGDVKCSELMIIGGGGPRGDPV